MWTSVAGVLAPEKRAKAEPVRTGMICTVCTERRTISVEESVCPECIAKATADRVCEACALWDGSVEALAEMRCGDDWRVTMAVISQGEQCYADVMRVCDAIVRSEGHFVSAYLGKSGHIYTAEMINRYRGHLHGGRLTFPDKDGMYRGEAEAEGDPWANAYDRRSAWRDAS